MSSAPINRNKPRLLVAYHANCIDGFTSAWIAESGLKDQGEGAIVDLLPVSYTAESESELYHTVRDGDYLDLYIVDFSLSCKFLTYLAASIPHLNVVILDHHKTAFEKYLPGDIVEHDSTFSGRICGAMVYLDNAMSGAGICWDYFYPGEPIPELVKYVQDYDLWLFNWGDTTKYINKFLVSRPKSLEVWASLAKGMQEQKIRASMIAEGKELQTRHMKAVDRICLNAIPLHLLGEDGLVVQCAREFTSDVGHKLSDKIGTFAAMYDVDPDSEDVTFSLRSVPEFDVSVMAKKLGGGGHKNAAGFTLPKGSDIASFIQGVD